MKPLLIADIDGVVANLVAVFLRPNHTYIPTAIQELNTFCEETSALVAPISARLRVQSAEYFQKSMRAAGFTGEFHPRLAVTRSWRPFSRSADLARFMEEEKIHLEELVIADDRPRYYTASQMSRLVQPDPEIGFNVTNRVQATLLLAAEQPEALKELQRYGRDRAIWGASLESQPPTRIHLGNTPSEAAKVFNQLHGLKPSITEHIQRFGGWRSRIDAAVNPALGKGK